MAQYTLGSQNGPQTINIGPQGDLFRIDFALVVTQVSTHDFGSLSMAITFTDVSGTPQTMTWGAGTWGSPVTDQALGSLCGSFLCSNDGSTDCLLDVTNFGGVANDALYTIFWRITPL